MLRDAGFTEVEGYGALFSDVDAVKAALAETGMKMTTAHIAVDDLESDPEKFVALAKELGMRAVYGPFLMPDDRPTDAEGWRAFGQRLAAAGKPFMDAGITFGWHNHDFELVDLGGGVTGLDCIAEAEGLTLELDLGWVARAGADPEIVLARFPGRISAVHVKDIAPAGENENEGGWADLGHGTVDYAALLPKVRAAGIDHFVLEHDNPADDKRFATRSLATFQTL
ncbi:sugar phosphate isomerase/epimerase [Pseudoroseicyclus sp. CLL3-39]|uniref:Sugar phosphate isomerase/epimerase n=2 Tax=Pseudoroseicyclus tamaricis TaxID=2705421 RepID=A0A6B2JZS8_9RHOB|nr:sugar phosphate isomerase/epimerase [Pseudoroseicyclus tamaricis]